MDAPIYFLEGETMLEVNRLSNESAGCSPPLPPHPHPGIVQTSEVGKRTDGRFLQPIKLAGEPTSPPS